MPDGSYKRDILAWSAHQAELLRRLWRGEGVNDVDWEHVVEEIEDVGLSELHSVQSFLSQIIVHVLKLGHWPDSLSAGHWRQEIVTFQEEAELRFTPSMRQRIDLEKQYRWAIRRIDANEPAAGFAAKCPEACPFTLDELMNGDPADLAKRMRVAAG